MQSFRIVYDNGYRTQDKTPDLSSADVACCQGILDGLEPASDGTSMLCVPRKDLSCGEATVLIAACTVALNSESRRGTEKVIVIVPLEEQKRNAEIVARLLLAGIRGEWFGRSGPPTESEKFASELDPEKKAFLKPRQMELHQRQVVTLQLEDQSNIVELPVRLLLSILPSERYALRLYWNWASAPIPSEGPAIVGRHLRSGAVGPSQLPSIVGPVPQHGDLLDALKSADEFGYYKTLAEAFNVGVFELNTQHLIAENQYRKLLAWFDGDYAGPNRHPLENAVSASLASASLLWYRLDSGWANLSLPRLTNQLDAVAGVISGPTTLFTIPTPIALTFLGEATCSQVLSIMVQSLVTNEVGSDALLKLPPFLCRPRMNAGLDAYCAAFLRVVESLADENRMPGKLLRNLVDHALAADLYLARVVPSERPDSAVEQPTLKSATLRRWLGPESSHGLRCMLAEVMARDQRAQDGVVQLVRHVSKSIELSNSRRAIDRIRFRAVSE